MNNFFRGLERYESKYVPITRSYLLNYMLLEMTGSGISQSIIRKPMCSMGMRLWNEDENGVTSGYQKQNDMANFRYKETSNFLRFFLQKKRPSKRGSNFPHFLLSILLLRFCFCIFCLSKHLYNFFLFHNKFLHSLGAILNFQPFNCLLKYLVSKHSLSYTKV